MAMRLSRSPNLARRYRTSPLPPGVILVIRVAAGCPESCSLASEQSGADIEAVSRAASLYLLVVLFDRESDPHRMLGLVVGASAEELREHKIWLLKWLHPDRNPHEWSAALAVRVLDAWKAASAMPPPTALPSPAEPPVTEIVPEESGRLKRRRRKGHVWVPLSL